MNRDELPDSDTQRAAWMAGLRWCSNCRTWVRAEEWHRQYRCPGTVGVCRDCIRLDDEKEKRIAPEAVVELKVEKRPPPVLSRLWADEDDE